MESVLSRELVTCPRQEAVVLDPDQFVVGDRPLPRRPPAAAAFPGANAPQSAPLAHGEFRLAEDFCNFGGAILLLDLALPHQQFERLLEAVEPTDHVVEALQ